MSFAESNSFVTDLIDKAKKNTGMTDEGIARSIGGGLSSIRNARSEGRMEKMSFWKIQKIAELAGYKVVIVKEGSNEVH